MNKLFYQNYRSAGITVVSVYKSNIVFSLLVVFLTSAVWSIGFAHANDGSVTLPDGTVLPPGTLKPGERIVQPGVIPPEGKIIAIVPADNHPETVKYVQEMKRNHVTAPVPQRQNLPTNRSTVNRNTVNHSTVNHSTVNHSTVNHSTVPQPMNSLPPLGAIPAGIPEPGIEPVPATVPTLITAQPSAPAALSAELEQNTEFEQNAEYGQAAEIERVAEIEQTGEFEQRTVASFDIQQGCKPIALWRYLNYLQKDARTSEWATQVATVLQTLTNSLLETRRIDPATLQYLNQMSVEGMTLAAQYKHDTISLYINQICFGLRRRLPIWSYYAGPNQGSVPIGGSASTSAMSAVAAPGAVSGENTSESGSASASSSGNVSVLIASAQLLDSRAAFAKTSECQQRLSQFFGRQPSGQAWENYLFMNELKQAAPGSFERRESLVRTLSNLQPTSPSPAQKMFLNSGLVQEFILCLSQELQAICSQQASTTLLQELEQYEANPRPAQASRLGRYILEQKLMAGANASLLPHLENSYRNANLRFAVSQRFLTRMSPAPVLLSQPVNEVINNRSVQGNSVTQSQPVISLLPDPANFRALIEIRGLINANTVSQDSGMNFYQKTNTNFVARLPLVFSVQGLSHGQTQVLLDTQTELQQVETGVDMIPIIGSVVQEVARSQHRQQSDQAVPEVQQKTTAQIKANVYRQTQPRFARVNQFWQDKICRTLLNLGLDITPIDAETSRTEGVMRLRIAGKEQLAASTPRPQAVENALVNVQIHESLINNLFQRFQLEGQSLKAHEIPQWFEHRLGRSMFKDQIEQRDDLLFTFADQNPIWVRFDGDRIVIRLCFSEILLRDQTFNNVEVEAIFRKRIKGMEVALEREEYVRIIGRFGVRQQVVLRTLFNKFFSADRDMYILPEKFSQDERMRGVKVTQFTTAEGWLAVSLGD